MRQFLLALILSGCSLYYGDDAPSSPDAAIGVIPIPCNTQHENCDAARDAAVVICDRRYRCDDLYDVPRDKCVHDVVLDLCTTIQCDRGPYERRAELDACLADYAAAACDEATMTCSL